MGVLNITPDSFYDGGRFNSVDTAIQQAAKMLDEGATIIDIGAFSTRPGADEIDETEELKRLMPVVTEIRASFPDAILSIDTFRSAVAEKVVEKHGDCIINDISGGTLDRRMFETISRLKVPYILMHIQGTPRNMQQNPTYKNVTKDVIKQLSEGVYRLHEMGVSDVIIDAGFGFGKTLAHNYELFNQLDTFRLFELPVLVGVSRKSMIYKLLKITPEESLNGTTVLNTLALQAGADILRVHDVKPAMEAVKIFNQLKRFAS
ncbi:MAG: dihydropteroate synthase [Prolixibacteraceae bacterium]|nr:dihydropteroate synthase [Prolixibacteraceae bacterium]